ncbi:MAG: hypothetical protein AMK71_07900 [Nitrospira bacterium SG8_35_4]|nr:MAG: hypothetical protein AMK71_07900 [Nitrospira bacterium SG8_35_4]
MKKHVLPEFQEYLRSKSLVNEKYIPYYANWAIKFLSFSSEKGYLSHELTVEKFLNHLKSREKISDWQVRQANDAIQLYVHQFLERNELRSEPLHSEDINNPMVRSKIIEEMRQTGMLIERKVLKQPARKQSPGECFFFVYSFLRKNE